MHTVNIILLSMAATGGAIMGFIYLGDYAEKKLGIDKLTQRAEELLGGKEKAEEWLATPAEELDGKKPQDLYYTEEGRQRLRELLESKKYLYGDGL